MPPELRKINCPNCNAAILWSDLYPHRPFCSQRCKLIDFGDWAMERFAIAGELQHEQLSEDEQDDS